MGTNSKIEWCDHTLNFWIGCTKVSAACNNCYMYRDARRRGFDPNIVRRTSAATWRQPLVKARATGEYKWKPGAKIFVCSWSDFFHADAGEWRHEAITLMMERPDLKWMILTKRQERAVEFFADYSPSIIRTVIPNLSLGVTVENNAERWRIDELLKLRPYAKVLFVSAEPLLGELDLEIPRPGADLQHVFHEFPAIDWMIAGGESGPGARPSHPDWVRKIRDDCVAAGVPFFFKQMSKKMPIPKDLQIREFPNAD